MFVSRLLVLLSPPFSVFATRKEMEKHNATPRRKGESPKKEEERGQSKVGGPSSHFCVVLLFSPLSFRVVLLGVVMLSHRSLVWRFFPFLGGAVFSFWVVLLSPSPPATIKLASRGQSTATRKTQSVIIGWISWLACCKQANHAAQGNCSKGFHLAITCARRSPFSQLFRKRSRRDDSSVPRPSHELP